MDSESFVNLCLPGNIITLFGLSWKDSCNLNCLLRVKLVPYGGHLATKNITKYLCFELAISVTQNTQGRACWNENYSGRNKAIPLQAWKAQRFQEEEDPRFQDNRHKKVVRLSALRTGRLYPKTYSCYLCLLEAESTPGP
jgi:hypothetical protein